jgi:hypothetical protein
MYQPRIDGVAFRRERDGSVSIVVAFKDGRSEPVTLTEEEWRNAVGFVSLEPPQHNE